MDSLGLEVALLFEGEELTVAVRLRYGFMGDGVDDAVFKFRYGLGDGFSLSLYGEDLADVILLVLFRKYGFWTDGLLLIVAFLLLIAMLPSIKSSASVVQAAELCSDLGRFFAYGLKAIFTCC
jgi:hypothetical protein